LGTRNVKLGRLDHRRIVREKMRTSSEGGARAWDVLKGRKRKRRQSRGESLLRSSTGFRDLGGSNTERRVKDREEGGDLEVLAISA